MIKQLVGLWFIVAGIVAIISITSQLPLSVSIIQAITLPVFLLQYAATYIISALGGVLASSSLYGLWSGNIPSVVTGLLSIGIGWKLC